MRIDFPVARRCRRCRWPTFIRIRAHLVAHHQATDELFLALVEQVQRGAIGLDQVGQLAQDQLEQVVEVEGRAQRDSDLTQRGRDPAFAAKRFGWIKDSPSGAFWMVSLPVLTVGSNHEPSPRSIDSSRSAGSAHPEPMVLSREYPRSSQKMGLPEAKKRHNCRESSRASATLCKTRLETVRGPRGRRKKWP